MYLLQVCVLGVVAVVALAQDCNPSNCPPCEHGNPFCDHHGACHCHAKRQTQCTTSSDCPHTCPHGQHNVCEQVHGSGQGGGEWQCVCRHNKRMEARQDCNPANCPPCEHGNPFCDHHGACHCHAKRQTQCTTSSDCPHTCPHGQHNVCEQVHGSGQGGGEWQCVCRHNKRMEARQDCNPANCPPCEHGNPFCDHHGACHCHAKRQTQCTTTADCPKTCGHGETNVCEQVHGTGVGGGEWQCVCRHNKRMNVVVRQDCDPANCPACDHGNPFCDHHGQCHCHAKRQTQCTTSSDCPHTCPHGQHNVCEQVHGSGQGGGEWQCVCRHNKRMAVPYIRQQTDHCLTDSDCASLHCDHGEQPWCDVNNVGGLGEHKCLCRRH